MSEVPLYPVHTYGPFLRSFWEQDKISSTCGYLGAKGTEGCKVMRRPKQIHLSILCTVQGYLAHKKTPPPRTLQ